MWAAPCWALPVKVSGFGRGRPVVMVRTCVVFAVPAYIAAVNPAAYKNIGYGGDYNYRK